MIELVKVLFVSAVGTVILVAFQLAFAGFLFGMERMVVGLKRIH
jgi:hypothetical protein